MAKAQDDEEVKEISDHAQEIGDKIFEMAEGHTRLAVMGAITVVLATIASDAEAEGLPIDYFLDRFSAAVRRVVIARRALDQKASMQ